MGRGGLVEEKRKSGKSVRIGDNAPMMRRKGGLEEPETPEEAEVPEQAGENDAETGKPQRNSLEFDKKRLLTEPDGGEQDSPDASEGMKKAIRRRYRSRFQEEAGKPGERKESAAAEAMEMDAGEGSSSDGDLAGDSDEAAEPARESANEIAEHSVRMENIRGHPSNVGKYAEAAAETRHARQKKQVQYYARKKRAMQEETKESAGQTSSAGPVESEGVELSGKSSGETLEGFREQLLKKTKREQLYKNQRRPPRLKEEAGKDGMVYGAGTGMAKRAASAAAGTAAAYVHGKGHEAEQENAAVEGGHRAELMTEHALRHALRRTRSGFHKRASLLRSTEDEPDGKRLQFDLSEGVQNTSSDAAAREVRRATGEKTVREEARSQAVKKFWQKQRYKKARIAANQGRQEAQETVRMTQTVFAKTKRAVAEVAGRNKGILGAVAAIVLLFALIATSVSSCGSVIQGTTSTFAATTYPSTDEDIYAVENAYAALEDALNEQINDMENEHPGYDEYRYQVDEISHNPYHLISYFTAKYGQFTYEQVKEELEEIFRQQYSLSTEETVGTVTETRTVRVGESLGPVVTSGYCNCPLCCGVWSGGPTAIGVYPTANHTIAVDAYSPFVPLGTRIIMNGVEYVVEDTGAFSQYGVQFDVYYDSHAAASAHGHQTWEAYIADDNGDREVEVTSTRQVDRLDVTLTNHDLDSVLRSRMDDNEETRYDLYNTTYGNRDYLFDINTLPGSGADGFGYRIPAEALSDRRFANMIREAEKYLGYPYVWGGSSPETSFDCSGFVCWVINHCGNGWNVGRTTADDLRRYCAYVPPEQARPGDLIFFQGTYDTPGASHIGIYVGNNMMIHCGNPIQYTSIATPYWQQHFMAFGRLN